MGDISKYKCEIYKKYNNFYNDLKQGCIKKDSELFKNIVYNYDKMTCNFLWTTYTYYICFLNYLILEHPNDIELIEYIIDNIPYNSNYSKFLCNKLPFHIVFNPLLYGILSNLDIKIIKKLLYIIDIKLFIAKNIVLRNSLPILHLALKYNCSNDIIYLILEYNPDITIKDDTGKQAIDYALQNGYSEDIIYRLKILKDTKENIFTKLKNSLRLLN